MNYLTHVEKLRPELQLKTNTALAKPMSYLLRAISIFHLMLGRDRVHQRFEKKKGVEIESPQLRHDPPYKFLQMQNLVLSACICIKR